MVPTHVLQTLFGLVLFLFSLGLAQPASAAPAVACHCFQDRAYDPERPGAFDPYLLATVQNRLFAHTFDLPRKEIVSSKMGGLPGDRLWIAHWVAEASGVSAAELFARYDTGEQWPEIVVQVSADPEQLGTSFVLGLSSGASESLLARAVVHHVLITRLEITQDELQPFEQNIIPLKEAILASVMASITDKEPGSYLEKRRDHSWGTLVAEEGLTLEGIETYLANRLQ